jgi:hypothetical protein
MRKAHVVVLVAALVGLSLVATAAAISDKQLYGKLNGATIMGVVTRNVVAGAGTVSTDNEDSGDCTRRSNCSARR